MDAVSCFLSNRVLEWFGNSLKWPGQKKLALSSSMKLMPSEVGLSMHMLSLYSVSGIILDINALFSLLLSSSPNTRVLSVH